MEYVFPVKLLEREDKELMELHIGDTVILVRSAATFGVCSVHDDTVAPVSSLYEELRRILQNTTTPEVRQ